MERTLRDVGEASPEAAPPLATPTRVRVWDLPTRLFHWVLAACVLGSIISAKIGGNAMAWHFRFGYVVLTLLAFRLAVGLCRRALVALSRASSTRRATTLRYLRGESRADEHHDVGHNPLGAFSVFGLLGIAAAAGRDRAGRGRRDREHRPADQVRLGRDQQPRDELAQELSASG